MIEPAGLAIGLALGLGLGILTGLPLGVMNVAVASVAATRGRAPATRLGLGGASADAVHAALAFTGLGPALAGHAALTRIATVIAGLACIAVAAALAIGARATTAAPSAARGRFWIGVALTLPNPAAISAWVMVATAVGPVRWPVAIATAIGVGVGSAGYFAGLAAAAARAQRPPPAAVLDRIAAVVLAALGVIALARVVAG